MNAFRAHLKQNSLSNGFQAEPMMQPPLMSNFPHARTTSDMRPHLQPQQKERKKKHAKPALKPNFSDPVCVPNNVANPPVCYPPNYFLQKNSETLNEDHKKQKRKKARSAGKHKCAPLNVNAPMVSQSAPIMQSAKSCSPSPYLDMPGAMMAMQPNAGFYNPQSHDEFHKSQPVAHTKMKKRKKKSDRVERNQRKKQRKKPHETPMIEIGVMTGGLSQGGTMHMNPMNSNNVNPFMSPEQIMAMNQNAANGAQPKRVKKAKRKKKKKRSKSSSITSHTNPSQPTNTYGAHKHMKLYELPNAGYQLQNGGYELQHGKAMMQPNMPPSKPPFMMTKTSAPPGSTPPLAQCPPPPPPPMTVQKNSIIEISSQNGRRHSHPSKSPVRKKGSGKNNKRVSPHSFPAEFTSYDAFVGLFNVKPEWVPVGMPGEITTICTVKFVNEIRDVKLVQVSQSEFEVFLNTNATCKQLMKILEHAQNSNVESPFHLEIRKIGSADREYKHDTRLMDVVTSGRETVQVYGMLTQQGRCCVIS